jgi:formylglycine-generating enzyme required for sulfatase activity
VIARPEDIVSMTPAPMVAPNISILAKSVFASDHVSWTEDDIQRRAKRTELGKDSSIDTPKPKPTPKATASLKRCDGVETLVANARRCLKPKDSFKDCPECPDMVVVPAGEFMMGSPEDEEGRSSNEGPQRKVTIPKPFAVGR